MDVLVSPVAVLVREDALEASFGHACCGSRKGSHDRNIGFGGFRSYTSVLTGRVGILIASLIRLQSDQSRGVQLGASCAVGNKSLFVHVRLFSL